MKKTLLFALALTSLSFNAAAKVVVQIDSLTSSPTGSLGTVTLEDSRYGLKVSPNLTQLSPGVHGFHIHQMPSCSDTGNAAGGHLDPKLSNAHNGPYEKVGHLGDLPALTVDANGNANLPTLAPRLTEKQLIGHSLMIHAGGDNYSDTPQKLGGGGARIACGVVEASK